MDQNEFFCELFKIVLNNQATIMKSMIDIEQTLAVIYKHDIKELDAYFHSCKLAGDLATSKNKTEDFIENFK